MTEPATDPDTVPFPRPASDERTAELEDRIRKLEASLAEKAAVPPPPTGAVLVPPTTAPTSNWLLGELRLILRMYFDPRYRISRTTQFAIPGILGLLVFNYFFFSVWFSVLIVSPVLERGLAVIFGVIGYRLITREVARYRGVLDYLARYGGQ